MDSKHIPQDSTISKVALTGLGEYPVTRSGHSALGAAFIQGDGIVKDPDVACMQVKA